jgi:hypothetical protein
MNSVMSCARFVLFDWPRERSQSVRWLCRAASTSVARGDGQSTPYWDTDIESSSHRKVAWKALLNYYQRLILY